MCCLRASIRVTTWRLRCVREHDTRWNILCSSLFPDGRTLVLPYKDGQNLADIWDDLNDRERTHVREECEKAIHILRSLSIYVPDVGKYNVLYERETGAVTRLDFETAIECLPSEHVPYVELVSLFGDPVEGVEAAVWTHE
jgi:hypothetical protein